MFCNRTLNMRSIKAVGFDMDYTLVHYHTEVWEKRAFAHAKRRLLERGWPVESLEFQRELTSPGLLMDVEQGNLVKVNRFGHVRRACHGTTMLGFVQMQKTYTSLPLDLPGPRWQFLDTLFSLSESCLFLQLVDLLDAGRLEPRLTYRELARAVREAIDATHLMGALKAEIMAHPDRFVVSDPQLGQTLLDLRQSGKSLLLITNSEWEYTRAMMSHALGQGFAELFSLVVVKARKPGFFSSDSPAFLLVGESGLLKPHTGRLELPNVYLGGNARLVEQSLDVRGEEILYLGDHIYADVHACQDLMRWRTGLVVRELEEELLQLSAFLPDQVELDGMMRHKALLEHEYSHLRLAQQRHKNDPNVEPAVDLDELRFRREALRTRLDELDARIAPLAERSSRLVNERWGQLMRAGADKSYLARQIERHADIYMSRVSNLLQYTPFCYFRATRVTLPHDVEVGTDW